MCVLVPLQLFVWFSLILRTLAHIPAKKNLPGGMQISPKPTRQQRIIGFFLWGGQKKPDLSHFFVAGLDLSLVGEVEAKSC